MPKYVVMDRNTARGRGGSFLRIVATLGLIALAAVGGTRAYNSISANNRAGTIENAIEQHRYTQAAQLLESYTGKGKISQPAAERLRASLESGVRRQPYMQRFDTALDTFALDDARSIIKEMESNGLADKKLLTSLEARVQDLTPETLYQHILAAKPDQREPLLRQYITAYPKGEHAPEVLSEASAIMVSKLIDLEQSINAGRAFDETYAKLVSINQDLAAYAGKGVNLSVSVPTAEIQAEVDEYLQLQYYPSPKGVEPKRNSKVKIVDVPITITDFKKKYVEERNANFPIGSIGEVVAIADFSAKYYVRFAPSPEHKWSETWDLNDYWLSGNKNVAYFGSDEVILIVSVTAIQKTQFNQQAETLVELIGKSSTSETGPQR